MLMQEPVWAVTQPSLPRPTPALLTSSALAQNPLNIDISFKDANVKEAHTGSNGRMIVLIEDAHSNYSGQMATARTLDHLMKAYRSYLVLVEGAAKDATLTSVKSIADKKSWSIAAKRFLQDGVISGEEYLNLVSDHPMEIQGVEYQRLYDSALDTYADLLKQRPQILSYLHKIDASIQRLKSRIYPQYLLDYEQYSWDASGDSQNWENKFNFLLRLAGSLKTELSAYPEIVRLNTLKRAEGAFSFERMNKEQEMLLERLTGMGLKDRVEAHMEALRKSGGHRINRAVLMGNLLDLAASQGIPSSQLPELRAYLKYLRSFSDLNFEEVLRQVDALEDAVYTGALAGDDALKLRAVDRFVGLLNRAYRIRMSSADFKTLMANHENFSTGKWEAFLNDQAASFEYFEDLVPYRTHFEKAVGLLTRFYRLADERDEAFLENAGRILDEKETNMAFLIAGGYHTENLARLMRESGYSYAVLTPWVEYETDQDRYEKMLLMAHSNPGDEKSERSLASTTTERTSVSTLVAPLLTANPKIAPARFSETYSDSSVGGVDVQKFAVAAARLATQQPLNDNLTPSPHLSIVGFFPGLASRDAYQHLGSSLYDTGEPAVRKVYEQAARIMGFTNETGEPDPSPLFLDPKSLPEDPQKRDVLMSVAFVVHSVALNTLFLERAKNKGIQVEVKSYAGEDFGMLAAAIVTGAMSLEDGIRFAERFTPCLTNCTEQSEPPDFRVVGIRSDQLEGILWELAIDQADEVELYKEIVRGEYVGVYVDRKAFKTDEDFEKYLKQKFPDAAIELTPLESPRHVAVNSRHMERAREQLDKYIHEDGIEFHDPSVPIISNDNTGTLTSSLKIAQAILSIVDRPVYSSRSATDADAIGSDLVIEFGVGGRVNELMETNHIVTPFTEFTGSEQAENLYRMLSQVQVLKQEIEKLKNGPQESEISPRQYNLMRNLFVSMQDDPFIQRFFFHLLSQIVKDAMLNDTETRPPAFYRYLQIMQNTYLVQHVIKMKALSSDALVLSAVFKKRINPKKRGFRNKIDIEILTFDRNGSTSQFTFNDFKYPESIAFVFSQLPVPVADLMARTRSLMNTQPSIEEIYYQVTSDLGLPPGYFTDDLGSVTLERSAIINMMYQYAMFRLTQLYRPAIFGQNLYRVTGTDNVGDLVAYAASGALSISDSIRLYRILQAETPEAARSFLLERAKDADIKFLDPKSGLTYSTRESLVNYGMNLSENRPEAPKLESNTWAIVYDASVPSVSETAKTLPIVGMQDLWQARVNSNLDLLDRLSILRLTNEHGKVFRFASGRGTTTENVYSYVNAGEEVLGFGNGGSQAMVILLREGDNRDITVRKILSEQLYSTRWDEGGQGPMLAPFKKAMRQVEYIQNLPENTAEIFPNILNVTERSIPIEPSSPDFKPFNGGYHEMIYDMTYVPGLDVSEFVKTYDTPSDVVASIYTAIFKLLGEKVHSNNRRTMQPDVLPTLEVSYFDKIEKRLALTRGALPKTFNHELMTQKTIRINGRSYLNVPEILRILRSHPEYLQVLEPRVHSLVMGDTNTENIRIYDYQPILDAMQQGRPVSASDVHLKFFDPRAIGFSVNGKDTGADDLMYDLTKPWHNSLGHYDMIHARELYLNIETDDDSVPSFTINFSDSSPYAFSYADMQRHFKDVMTESLNLDDPNSEFLKEDPYWIIRFAFVMGTHFAAMPPFHIAQTQSGDVVDEIGSQQTPLALYAEGVQWLNLALEMLEGRRSEYLGIAVPELPYAKQNGPAAGARLTPAVGADDAVSTVFMARGNTIAEQEKFLRDFFSKTPLGRSAQGRPSFITHLTVDRDESSEETLFVTMQTIAGHDLRFNIGTKDAAKKPLIVRSFKVGFGAGNTKSKELQSAYGDRGKLSNDLLLALLSLLQSNGVSRVTEVLVNPGSEKFFENALGSAFRRFYRSDFDKKPYSISKNGMRFMVFESDEERWLPAYDMVIDLDGFDFSNDLWESRAEFEADAEEAARAENRPVTATERLARGPADMSNESRVFFSPWSRLARGTGLGPHTIDFDATTARRLRDSFDALKDKVPADHAYNQFSRLLTELILDAEDPAVQMTSAELTRRTEAILNALDGEKSPYAFVTAASILMDAYAKLGLDPTLLVNASRDLLGESLQKIQTIPFKEDGIYGYYERVTAYTGLFVAAGQLGFGDRLVGETDHVQTALDQLQTIPSPWNRGRGASMLFAALKVLGFESYLTENGRDYIRETFDYIDRADELDIWPTFPAVPLTHAYFTIEPYLTMLNAVSVLGKPEYLTYKEDRIEKVRGMMERLSPEEKMLIAEYYLLTLHNLGVMGRVVPDVDAYLSDLLKELDGLNAAPHWFPNGVAYPYAMEAAWFFGRSDLVTEKQIDHMIESMPGFTDDKDTANWGHPVSYILNTLGQMDRLDKIFEPNAVYQNQPPMLWAIDRFAGNETGLQKSLPLFDHALISLALRMRGRDAGETPLYRSVTFLGQDGALDGVRGARFAAPSAPTQAGSRLPLRLPKESRVGFINGWNWVSRGLGIGQFEADYDAEMAQNLKTSLGILREKVPADNTYNAFVTRLTEFVLDQDDPARVMTGDDVRVRTEELVALMRKIEGSLLFTNASALLFESYGKLGLDASYLVNSDHDLVAEALNRVPRIDPLENTGSGSIKAQTRGNYDQLVAYAQLFVGIGQLGLTERLLETSPGTGNYVEQALSVIDEIPSPFVRGRYAPVLFSALKVIGQERFISQNTAGKDYMIDLLDYLDNDANRLIDDPLSVPNPGRGFNAVSPEYRTAYPAMLTLIAISALGQSKYLHYKKDRVAEAGRILASLREKTPEGIAGDDVAKHITLYLTALENLGELDNRIPDLDAFLRGYLPEIFSKINDHSGYAFQLMWMTGHEDWISADNFEEWVRNLNISHLKEIKRYPPYMASQMLGVLGQMGHDRARPLFAPNPAFQGEAPFPTFLRQFTDNEAAVKQFLPMLNHALLDYALKMRKNRESKVYDRVTFARQGARLATVADAPDQWVLATPWARLARGMGLGRQPLLRDKQLEDRIRDVNDALAKLSLNSGGRHRFAQLLTRLVLDTPPLNASPYAARPSPDTARLREMVDALYGETDPYEFAIAASILLDTFAKFGWDASLLARDGRDLVGDALAKADTVPSKEDGIAGPYERLSALTALYLSLARAGLGERLYDGDRDRLAEALDLMDQIPSPWNRVRAAAVLFAAFSLHGRQKEWFSAGKNRLADLWKDLNASSESFAPLSSDFFKVCANLVLLSAVSGEAREENDALIRAQVQGVPEAMERVSPVERLLLTQYYLNALSNLGLLESEVPDLDAYLRQMVALAESFKPSGAWFPDGVVYPYVIETLKKFGREDLISERLLQQSLQSLEGNFTDPAFAVNRDNPLAYGFGALSQAGREDILFAPGTDGSTAMERMLKDLSRDDRMRTRGLPALENILIDLALRMRTPVPTVPASDDKKRAVVDALLKNRLLAGLHSEELIGKDSEEIVRMGQRFADKGVIPEIGAGKAGGMEAIRLYRKLFPSTLIAAGEIREHDPEQAVEAVRAGADILVALENPLSAEVVQAVRRENPAVVIIAAAHDEPEAVRSIEAGVDGIKIRPFALDPNQIQKNVELVKRLREKYPNTLVGGSRGIRPEQLREFFDGGLQFVGLGVNTAIEGADRLASQAEKTDGSRLVEGANGAPREKKEAEASRRGTLLDAVPGGFDEYALIRIGEPTSPGFAWPKASQAIGSVFSSLLDFREKAASLLAKTKDRKTNDEFGRLAKMIEQGSFFSALYNYVSFAERRNEAEREELANLVRERTKPSAWKSFEAYKNIMTRTSEIRESSPERFKSAGLMLRHRSFAIGAQEKEALSLATRHDRWHSVSYTFQSKYAGLEEAAVLQLVRGSLDHHVSAIEADDRFRAVDLNQIPYRTGVFVNLDRNRRVAAILVPEDRDRDLLQAVHDDVVRSGLYTVKSVAQVPIVTYAEMIAHEGMIQPAAGARAAVSKADLERELQELRQLRGMFKRQIEATQLVVALPESYMDALRLADPGLDEQELFGKIQAKFLQESDGHAMVTVVTYRQDARREVFDQGEFRGMKPFVVVPHQLLREDLESAIGTISYETQDGRVAQLLRLIGSAWIITYGGKDAGSSLLIRSTFGRRLLDTEMDALQKPDTKEKMRVVIQVPARATAIVMDYLQKIRSILAVSWSA